MISKISWIFCLCFLPALSLYGQDFQDVSSSDPYYSAVNALRAQKITDGCSASPPIYCPNSVISRGQMAVFIVRGIFWSILGDPENFTYTSTPYFSDVPVTHPFFKYIQKLRDLNITSGCTAFTFCTDYDISWGALTVFAVRSWEYRMNGVVTNSFATSGANYFPTDVPPNHAWYPYVTKAMDLGVIKAGCLAQPTSTYCIDTGILRGPAAFFIAGGSMGLVGSSKGISPTLTEINLSAVPIDMYYSLNGSGSTPIVDGCPTSITVRQCFQQLLSTGTDNWRGQGVTGVRFFFTLAGGYYSTPFDPAGNVQTAWTQNLYQFLADLRSYGIQRVTPTPVFDTWSGPPSLLQTRTLSACFDMYGNPTQTVALSFVPWLPYGLELQTNGAYYPDRSCGNQTYSAGAQTPSDIFWGWS